MPHVRDQAVVLRVWDWSETSQTAALFCRERGVVRGLAKGARREKTNFSGGFEVATRGEVMAIVKAGSELATLTEWDLQEVFRRLRTDLTAHYAGMACMDVVFNAVTDADPHPGLWDALLEALRAIDAGDDPVGATLALQWSALVEAGYAPDLDGPLGARGAVGFDPALGKLVADPGAGSSEEGAGAWRVRVETIRLLRSIASPGTLADEECASAVTRRRAARLLASYGRWILGHEVVALGVFLEHAEARARG